MQTFLSRNAAEQAMAGKYHDLWHKNGFQLHLTFTDAGGTVRPSHYKRSVVS
jgi:hypothetical protein